MSDLLVVDTDILIDIGRGIDKAVSFWKNTPVSTSLALSAITSMELMIGARDKTELHTIERFLTGFQVLAVNDAISDIALDLLREYHLSHGLLIADCLIAATAISLDFPLITKNQKDYRFIKKLQLKKY